jgi:hypothetical protein
VIMIHKNHGDQKGQNSPPGQGVMPLAPAPRADVTVAPAFRPLPPAPCKQASAVLTNVPGPSHKRAICGRRIDEIMFWVPGLGSIGVVFSLFTYGDKVSLGKEKPRSAHRGADLVLHTRLVPEGQHRGLRDVGLELSDVVLQTRLACLIRSRRSHWCSVDLNRS